jgi:hypothetical protein
MQKDVKEAIQPVTWVVLAVYMDVLPLLVQIYVSVYVLWAEELVCIMKCRNEKLAVVQLAGVIAKVIGDLVTAYVQMAIGCVMRAVEVLEVMKATLVKAGIANVLFIINFLDVLPHMKAM